MSGSHFWEDPAFENGPNVFKANVVDLLGPGDGTSEMPGLAQFTGAGGRLCPATNPRAFTATPGFVSTGNIFYPNQVNDISGRLKAILGQNVPLTPILYEPVDPPDESGSESGSEEDYEWTPDRRFLFQYDPAQQFCNGVQTAMWKLWVEGEVREQGSWTARNDQLVARRKRQESATEAAAVCSASSTSSASSTRSSSAKEPSGSTYADYLALKILNQEVVNQPNGLPPIDDLEYYYEVWEIDGDSKPDYCDNPTRSMSFSGATPDTQKPYPTVTITSLQPSGTSGPTCMWIPSPSDSGVFGPGYLSCKVGLVSPTTVACLALENAPVAECGNGVQIYPGVQCIWQGD